MNNLFELVYQCLYESDLDKKLLLSKKITGLLSQNEVEIKPFHKKQYLNQPGCPDKPVLVSPKELPKRNIHTNEGRAAMIHSFAHIEFNAINLALDLIIRFQGLPDEFYYDWLQVASEETKHFELLRQYLSDMGYDYGDYPAHDGLWKIAEKTKGDVLLRLAVVPRIMEARGLDVTPDLINRFRKIKDHKIVSILELILEEEIGHVSIGTKWYRYFCEKLSQDPEEKFKQIINEYLPSNKTSNINYEARLTAGFSQSELDYIASV